MYPLFLKDFSSLEKRMNKAFSRNAKERESSDESCNYSFNHLSFLNLDAIVAGVIYYIVAVVKYHI